MSVSRTFLGIGTRVLWITGLSVILRRILTAGGRYAVELHGVSNWGCPELLRGHRPAMTASGLDALLEWLAPRFALLTPEEFLFSGKEGVLLTFDDGLANNWDVAVPVLERFRCPALFFVATQHVEDPSHWLTFSEQSARSLWGSAESVPEEAAADLFNGMSRDQVRMCASHPLVTIGSHTVSHPRLTGIADDALRAELEHSKSYLEMVTDRPVTLLAYPFGDYDSRIVSAARDAGYEAAFAEDSRNLGIPTHEIPRIGVYETTRPYLEAKFSGIFRRPLRSPILNRKDP